MTPRFKDHFSGHASRYATHRPGYPQELFRWLVGTAAASTRRSESAVTVWDVATGNGQAACALSPLAGQVIATDASRQQLEQATHAEGVHYVCARSEEPPLAASSIQLVTVAQALHWFDVAHFFEAARRVCSPGAILAAWSYQLFTVDAAVDEIVAELYAGEVGAFWPPERRHIEAHYESIPWPLKPLDPPPFKMQIEWGVDQAIGYLRTWSSVNAYMREHGADPVSEVEPRLRAAWGPDRRRVDWPFILKTGLVSEA